MNAYELLKSRYGGSAATTYDYNRVCGRTASESIARMRAQVGALGTDYPGGLECTPYRQQSAPNRSKYYSITYRDRSDPSPYAIFFMVYNRQTGSAVWESATYYRASELDKVADSIVDSFENSKTIKQESEHCLINPCDRQPLTTDKGYQYRQDNPTQQWLDGLNPAQIAPGTQLPLI